MLSIVSDLWKLSKRHSTYQKQNTNVKLWLMVFLALPPVSSLRRQVRADLGVNLVIWEPRSTG